MTDLIAERVAELDASAFAQTTERAAWELATTGYALVHLEPDDCTVYPIMVVAPRNGIETGQGHRRTPYYMVALACSFGGGMVWAGGAVDVGYVHGKIGRDHEYTSHILTRFLNELAVAIRIARARDIDTLTALETSP